jgi:hypothetical protein
MGTWIVGGENQEDAEYSKDTDDHLKIIRSHPPMPNPVRRPNDSQRIDQEKNDAK